MFSTKDELREHMVDEGLREGVCPHCEAGMLVSWIDSRKFTALNKVKQIDIFAAICPDCRYKTIIWE